MENEEITPQEIESVRAYGLPRNPDFPILIILFALLKDGIFDVLSVGLLGWVGSATLGLIIWFWITSKTGFIQKRLMRYVVRRYLVALVIGIIPGLNFIPEATILVLLVHNKEKKVVKLFLEAVGKVKI
jgi:hypothetical protein